ncbi:MAG: hypothetical protein FJZ57_00350 [Chlamydiae bacterium]|nr:hypothetical protein [Chlamydiota bacterium]
MDRRIPAWACIVVGAIFLICGAYSSFMYDRSLLDKLRGANQSNATFYFVMGSILCLVGVAIRLSKMIKK